MFISDSFTKWASICQGPLVAAPRELPGKRCMSAHCETVSFNAMWVDFGDVDKLFFPALSLLRQLRLPHISPRERPASKLSPVWAKTTPLSGGKGVTVKNVSRINIQLPSQHNKNKIKCPFLSTNHLLWHKNCIWSRISSAPANLKRTHSMTRKDPASQILRWNFQTKY